MNAIRGRYSCSGELTFAANESLSAECDAPDQRGGIYLVYNALSGEVIYIGSSGWINQDGSVGLRKGGMCDRIVNGKQSDGPRRETWPAKTGYTNN